MKKRFRSEVSSLIYEDKKAAGDCKPVKWWDNPIEAESNGHKWFRFGKDTFHSCRLCGMIRRADDKNLPCNGKVKVVLR